LSTPLFLPPSKSPSVPGFGTGSAPELQFRPVGLEPAVNGCRRNLQQLRSSAGINLKLLAPDAGAEPGPAALRRGADRTASPGPPSKTTAPRSPPPSTAADGRPGPGSLQHQRHPQRLAGVVAVPARRRARSSKICFFTALSECIAGGDDLRDSPAFTHRKLHGSPCRSSRHHPGGHAAKRASSNDSSSTAPRASFTGQREAPVASWQYLREVRFVASFETSGKFSHSRPG
jgi:hypothetical protein